MTDRERGKVTYSGRASALPKITRHMTEVRICIKITSCCKFVTSFELFDLYWTLFFLYLNLSWSIMIFLGLYLPFLANLGLSWSFLVYLYLSWLISVYLGSAWFILIYFVFSWSISGYLELSWAILDKKWDISGYLKLSWAILGYPELSWALSGYHKLSRLSLTISGYLWLFLVSGCK